MKKQQIQKQEQITAHEMEAVLDTFYNTLEPLEEYIGKAGYYSDWNNRRQVYRKTIADSNDTVEGFEDLFLTQLFITAASVNKKPEFFRKKIQEEFHKWINATKIDVNNCPEKLKHYLFGINEVLEGRGENFIKQTREIIKDKDLNPQEALGMFSQLQNPLNKNRERGEELQGKKWNEIEVGNRFGGNAEQGEEAFKKIAGTVSTSHDNFSYFPQQEKRTNSEIIQDIRQNPRNWRLDEVITEYDNQGRATKKELALIHSSAQIGFNGVVLDNDQPVYLAQRFDQRETAQINQALNVSQQPAQQQQTPYKWSWQ